MGVTIPAPQRCSGDGARPRGTQRPAAGWRTKPGTRESRTQYCSGEPGGEEAAAFACLSKEIDFICVDYKNAICLFLSFSNSTRSNLYSGLETPRAGQWLQREVRSGHRCAERGRNPEHIPNPCVLFSEGMCSPEADRNAFRGSGEASGPEPTLRSLSRELRCPASLRCRPSRPLPWPLERQQPLEQRRKFAAGESLVLMMQRPNCF